MIPQQDYERAADLVRDIPGDHPIRKLALHWWRQRQAWSTTRFQSPNERSVLHRLLDQLVASFPHLAPHLGAEQTVWEDSHPLVWVAFVLAGSPNWLPDPTTTRWSVEPATGALLEDVRAICEQHHYLHRYPDPRSLPLAYVLRADGTPYAPNGVLNGVIVFKKPQHHKQRDLFGYEGLPTAWQVLDLARVWINPLWQAPGLNLFSRMVGLALRRLQWDWLEHHPPRFPDLPYHITLVISYCELSHHDGTAYRACSFQRAGLTSDDTKELYYRRLRTPLKAWKLPNGVQLPLLEGVPLQHGN